MKGPQQRGWWSTRQQIVIISGDNADTWPDALTRLMESVRDVIDIWDDTEIADPTEESVLFHAVMLDERINMMRRRLHDLRQWDVHDDI